MKPSKDTCPPCCSESDDWPRELCSACPVLATPVRPVPASPAVKVASTDMDEFLNYWAGATCTDPEAYDFSRRMARDCLERGLARDDLAAAWGAWQAATGRREALGAPPAVAVTETPTQLGYTLSDVHEAFSRGAAGAVQGLTLLAKKHEGMRVDYSGLLGQCQRALRNCGESANAEMLRQFQGHMKELGQRWYAGDTASVDEILQLYCVEKDARAALAATTTALPASNGDAS